MFTIDSIQWPKNHSLALRLYLKFLVFVLDELRLSFSDHSDDPMSITKKFLDGVLSDEDRAKANRIWWNYIDERNAMREFKDRDVLIARLAICLLSVCEKDVDRLGENLSWFFEVLGFLGEDVDRAIKMMEEFFKPKV